MKKVLSFTAICVIITVLLLINGCTTESTAPVTPSVGQMVLPTFQPKGTISGKIYDRCTFMAISGAKISVGFDSTVVTTTSDASGSFAFANVPAGSYRVIDGRSVPTGTYLITASLVDYNKGQTDPSKRYRDYYYYSVTITFTSLVPGDSLGVSGLVGSVVCSLASLSATLKGTVVDQNYSTVENASVVLRESTTGFVLGQTRTSVDGSFQFVNIESGQSYILDSKSADGTLFGSTTKTITCNLPSDSLRSQVSAERIVLTPVDNVAPYITSITPENNSDVSVTGLQIVYRFSEPIQQTSYTRVNLGLGHGTIVDDITISFNGLKKVSAPLPLPTFAWNATFTQLIITPTGIVGSGKYSVTLNATARANLKDKANNALVNNAAITGDFETLNFTTAGGSSTPSAPVLTRRSVSGQIGTLDFGGGVVGLEWSVVPNARSYNIYRSIGNGSFELYRSGVFRLQDTVTSSSLVNPQGVRDPLGSLSVRFHVCAVSADLIEGPPSNILNIRDEVLPTLLGTQTGGSGNNWLYTLQFSEPLTVSSAQTLANYWIQDPDTVVFTLNDVDYLGYNTTSTRYHVLLNFSTNLPLPAGYSIRVRNQSDLAGNIIDSSANRYVSSISPVPVLASPNNGATTLGLPLTLSWNKSNGATSYRLQVSTNVGFTAIVFDSNNLSTPITGLSYQLGSTVLTVGTTYYWRVAAVNAVGTSAWSTPIRNFTP